MIRKNPFEAFTKILKEMTPEHKERLISAHRQFGVLRTFCEAKGYIEILPQLRGIKVLKNKPEVKALKEIVDTLKPGKFTWQEKGKEAEDVFTPEKGKKKGKKSS